jgi:hypothetical protein
MENPTPANEDPGQIAKLLLAHEQARARAWKEKNRQALEVLLAPDFMEINELGRLTKKDSIVALLPSLTLHEFTISDPKIMVVTAGAAILTYRCNRDLTVHGQRIFGDFLVAAHYVKRDNKWLLLLWQVTPVSGG